VIVVQHEGWSFDLDAGIELSVGKIQDAMFELVKTSAGSGLAATRSIQSRYLVIRSVCI